MIKYVKGNLLDDQAEALVNTVNEVGVMGRYPERKLRDLQLIEQPAGIASRDGLRFAVHGLSLV